jgi:hypothetical protein
MSNTPEMTRKEALAALHQLYARVGYHLFDEPSREENKVLQDKIWTALRILRHSIHGEAPSGYTDHLCEVCFLRYVHINSPFVFLKGDSIQKDLCTECLVRLKADGKVERVENWETGEVTPC